MTPRVHEIKKKKTKIGAIIASYDPSKHEIIPTNIANWTAGSATVILHGPISKGYPNGNGFNYVGHKSDPTIRAVASEYLTRIRGDGLVGFAKDGIIIEKDFSEVYRFADENRMERTFAFYVALENQESPELIVFSGGMIEHIFQRVPQNILFSSDGRQAWLHSFAKQAMMSHRYFDATKYGVISAIGEKTQQPQEPIPEPIVEEQVDQVKRKAGRPKKNG
jgi:hypothetical protein